MLRDTFCGGKLIPAHEQVPGATKLCRGAGFVISLNLQQPSQWGYDSGGEVCMKKTLAVVGVVLFWVVLSGATYAAHFGKCPLCWGK